MARHSIRVLSAPAKINTIKLIRELTRLGLKDAKEVSENVRPFELELTDAIMAKLDEHARQHGARFEISPPFEALAPTEPVPLDLDLLLHPDFEILADLRYVSGPRKIQAIKLVRELTNLGLKEAKDLVEDAACMRLNLPLQEAQRVAARFAEFESVVEIRPHAATLIAYDPRHPSRVRQPLTRMCITGPQLVLERGHIDAWTRAAPEDIQRFTDPADLQAAVETQRRAWQAAGLELSGNLLEFVNRLSPRNPELEQQLRDADDPTQPALVLADWLQSQGDPRGQLGALQYARATADANALLTRHATDVFGPLASELDLIKPELGRIEIDWTIGQVNRLALELTHELPNIDNTDLYAGLVSLPAFACIRELELSGQWLRRIDPIAAIPRETLSGLRALTLISDPWTAVELADWRPLTRLERLTLRVAQPRCGPLHLPALRTLSLRVQTVDTSLCQAFVSGALDQLVHLELEFGFAPVAEHWIGDYSPLLRELLDADTLTGLRRLVVRIERGTLGQPFAALLLGTRAATRLQHLDLAGCQWTPDARAWLDQHSRTLPYQVRLA